MSESEAFGSGKEYGVAPKMQMAIYLGIKS